MKATNHHPIFDQQIPIQFVWLNLTDSWFPFMKICAKVIYKSVCTHASVLSKPSNDAWVTITLKGMIRGRKKNNKSAIYGYN